MGIKSGAILGQVYNYQLAGLLPSGMTSSLTGATVVTNQQNSVQYAGGSATANTYTESIRTTTETYGQLSILTALVKPTVAGIGFTLSWFNASTGVNLGSYCRFNTTTNVLTVGYAGTDQASSSTALSYTLGSNVLEIKMYYSAETGLTTASIRIAGSSDSTPIIYAQAALQNSAVGVFGGISFHSGTVQVYEQKYKQLTTKYSPLLGYGDSNMFGLLNTYPAAYFNMLKAQTSQDIDSIAFSGSKTQDFIAQIAQNASLIPNVLLIGLGTNDGNLGVTLATYIANITTLVNAQITRPNPGIVILLSILPNNQPWSASVPTWNTSLAALANGTTVLYIDINTIVNNGSGNMNAGDTVEGVHLSNAGHLKVLGVLLANANIQKYLKV